MSGGGGTTNAVTKTDSAPWAEQKPYLIQGMKDAKSLYQQPGPAYYPGSTVAGFSPAQKQAQSLITNRATNNPLLNQASGYVSDVFGGKYLNSNPYNDQVFQNVQSKVMPAVNSTFGMAGRYGSGLHADAAARGLTEAYAPYASQQYDQGLQRMDNAVGLANSLQDQQMKDYNALNQVGGQQQNLAQQEIGDAQNRFNYYQDLPYNKLAQYMGLVQGNYGGQTTSTVPYNQPSPFGQILGGGLGLLGLLG
jgi:hypothetical protein